MAVSRATYKVGLETSYAARLKTIAILKWYAKCFIIAAVYIMINLGERTSLYEECHARSRW